MTAGGSVPGRGEGGPINQPASRRSFAEAAIRAEIAVLRRQLRELYETGGLLTAEEAGLKSEVPAEAFDPGHQTAADVPRAISDADGYDLRPNPLSAQTPAAFMAALRQFRTWAGDLSLRMISGRSHPPIAASTLCTALRGDALPTFAVVQAVITACGGSEDDRRRFTTAWRKLRLEQTVTESQPSGGHVATA